MTYTLQCNSISNNYRTKRLCLLSQTLLYVHLLCRQHTFWTICVFVFVLCNNRLWLFLQTAEVHLSVHVVLRYDLISYSFTCMVHLKDERYRPFVLMQTSDAFLKINSTCTHCTCGFYRRHRFQEQNAIIRAILLSTLVPLQPFVVLCFYMDVIILYKGTCKATPGVANTFFTVSIWWVCLLLLW